MIKYLENRLWSLNAKIINTNADPDEITARLNSLITTGIFSNDGIRFQYSSNPIGNYSIRQTEVTIELMPSALATYQNLLDKKEIDFRITSWRMIINAFGFLNILPVFEYRGDVTKGNISDVESNGDASAEILDGLFDEISAIIDSLHQLGIIEKSPYYHLGIPSGIEKYGIHTKDDSYNYLVHIFFFEEDGALGRLVSHYQAGEPATYDDHSYYAIFPLYYWRMSGPAIDDELVRLIAIDSYMTSELVAVNNALHVYNSFLDVLNMSHDVDSNHLRKIFNYNTWLIQNLRLFNPNFTLHQFRFIKIYRENSDITAKYDLLKDAENSLTFAIEGIEVTRTQQSERIMQFILALFTALTLYSVITDVYSLITNDEASISLSFYSPQTIIFVLETMVILSFIFFFRKISRRL